MPEVFEQKIPIKVGISACLLGEKVRWDAGHKHDRYLTQVLGEYFSFVPVCPEIEVGMSVPRESVRLVGDPESPRMVGNKTFEDWTERMNKYSSERTAKLTKEQLSGYVLKKDSPSCGMERVKVYGEKGQSARTGIGLYARALMERFPFLPVEEEGRLNDPRLRENFITRVFAYNRLLNLNAQRYSRGLMVQFHTVNKYLMLSHSQKHYSLLGKLVADVKKYSPEEMRDEYGRLYMEGLSFKTTTRKNVNVLQHILGHLRDHLSSDERQNILNVISDYHKQLVPLVVPLTLLCHYVKMHDVEYIRDQVYLNPHPKELMLRNHV